MDTTQSVLLKKPKLGERIINSFKEFGHAFAKGDLYVKLSALVLGVGFFKRKQHTKGIIYVVIQSLFITFIALIGLPSLVKLSTLGTVEYETYYDPALRDNVVNDYDNSFLILLYSLIAIAFILFMAILWFKNVKHQYQIQLEVQNGHKLPTMKEEIKNYLNEKFHITLLTLPITGIIIFTVIPLFFMFLIAFTNYDENHQPPIKLFTWVGFRNFNLLFDFSSTNQAFGYAFGVIIVWTLIWAFFATFLNYFGGIWLAMYINSKTVKWKKMWRTIFVLTIAIPQFVSLLLISYFFANYGIMNTLAENAGLLQFFKDIGLVKPSLDYIPFLSGPIWTRVMLILINCWIGFPYVMLIATGVLMNIPKDLYESAEIDGATKFQQFKSITMPYMLFVTAPYLITSFIHNMNNFNVIYLLTSNRATSDLKLAAVGARDVDLLVTWLFRLTSEQANFKMASTVGVILFLISVVFTLLAFNYVIRGNKEEDFQ